MMKKKAFTGGLAMFAMSVLVVCTTGCVSTGGTAMETHKKGMTSITEEEYFVTKKPVDRAFIGSAWSKQFGPIEDPGA